MKRRLYFLFSDNAQARSAVADLEGAGIEANHIHVLARSEAELRDLPPATDHQRHDLLKWIETTLWGGNLVLFGLAVAGLLLAVFFGNLMGAVLSLSVIIVSFTGGALFALHMPKTHLNDFQDALQRGELLLMVDVTRDCVDTVETLMRHRHPEAVTGSSTWTPGAFGI